MPNTGPPASQGSWRGPRRRDSSWLSQWSASLPAPRQHVMVIYGAQESVFLKGHIMSMRNSRSKSWGAAGLLSITVLLSALVLVPGGCPPASNSTGTDGTGGTGGTGAVVSGAAVVLGYNDLGMHCMNRDFSELMILPPYNTLHAQVIDRSGEDPHILTSGVTVSYTFPDNTHSADKTNFWQYAQALLGTALADNFGLAGNGLSGTMQPTGNNDWSVVGIPLTPIDDQGQETPYNLATITVERNGTQLAQTRAVAPVSWEINCDLCHNTAGISTATDILRVHDRLHGTTLENEKPVMCGTLPRRCRPGPDRPDGRLEPVARDARVARLADECARADEQVLRLPPGHSHAVPARRALQPRHDVQRLPHVHGSCGGPDPSPVGGRTAL